MIDEFKDDDSFLEECLKDENCSTHCDEAESNVDTPDSSTSENKKGNAKLWCEKSDGGESSQTSSANNADSSQSSLLMDISEDWFDDIDDDDWDYLNPDALGSTAEPNAKRKRL